MKLFCASLVGHFMRLASRRAHKNKTSMKTIITTLGALALATAITIAQDKPPGGGPGGPGGPDGQRPKPEDIFKKLDANSDNAISLDEFKAGPMGQKDPAKAEEIFKKIDKDGNGSLSLEEFKSGRPPHPPGGGGKPGEGGGGKPGGPGGRPPGGPGGGPKPQA